MNEFLLQNNLTILDLKYKQCVPYTYHNSVSSTYIDHVAASDSAVELTKECTIQALSYNNVSDHLPITTVLAIECNNEKNNIKINSEKEYHHINWDDKRTVSSYRNIIAEAADCLPDVIINKIKTTKQANRIVNEMCSALAISFTACVQKLSMKGKKVIKVILNLTAGGTLLVIQPAIAKNFGLTSGETVAAPARSMFISAINQQKKNIETYLKSQ